MFVKVTLFLSSGRRPLRSRITCKYTRLYILNIERMIKNFVCTATFHRISLRNVRWKRLIEILHAWICPPETILSFPLNQD